MIPELRARFNASFTLDKYARFLRRLETETGTSIQFRHCETPMFIERSLLDKMAGYGEELIHQLVDNPEYRKRSDATLPERYTVPNEDERPLFIQVDFGLTADLEPKLVEIQGFPSLYAYQPVLAEAFRSEYGLDPGLRALLVDDYTGLLRRAILGGHAPHEVALVELDPYRQKTLADFLVTAKTLGIRIVNIRDIRKHGNKLFAPDGPIERIYNRAIVDELERKDVQLAFDFRDELDVEWAGHPNWYFRISKFSIPFLNHPSVPRTLFLDRVSRIPNDLENWVLKPLYSFAGLGVSVGPTREEVERVADPSQYILQERVDFAPLIDTPYGPTKAEVRIMYIWDRQLQAVTTIVRMGRGKMMGVDHNRNMEWVGGSVAFYPAA
jgi:hypothetical protein